MQTIGVVRKFWLGVGLAVFSVGGHPMSVTLGVMAIATLTHPATAQAAVLTTWRFDPATRQLELTVPEGVTPRYFLLAQPARIVLDLPNTQVGAVPEVQTYSGLVRQIRVGQFQDGLTRIVMELSPDAVLAPGQADLQRAEGAMGEGQRGDRWILRPLFAEDTRPVATRPNPGATNAPAAPAESLPLTEQAIPPVQPAPVEPPLLAAPSAVGQEVSPVATAIAPPPSPSEGNPPASLPPLEPNATVIPIEPPAATAPSAPPLVARPASVPVPTSQAASLPTELPPAASQGDRPATVQVPPLNAAAAPPSTPSVPPPVSTLPPARPPGVPSWETAPLVQPAPVPPPHSAPAQPDAIAAANVLLPSGTVLSLRYPRDTALSLPADASWQEVLVLSQPLRDRSGTVIAPEGSQVIGRFETGEGGSRFIAQAITLQDRNVRLRAQSGVLAGDRQVSRDSLVRNSAIGGLALTVLGAFTGIGALAGIIAGASAGAATTYITAPNPATIQPNQIVEVRLLEDLPRNAN